MRRLRCARGLSKRGCSGHAAVVRWPGLDRGVATAETAASTQAAREQFYGARRRRLTVRRQSQKGCVARASVVEWRPRTKRCARRLSFGRRSEPASLPVTLRALPGRRELALQAAEQAWDGDDARRKGTAPMMAEMPGEVPRPALRVFPLHGILEGPACTCSQKAACKSIGKHPLVKWRTYDESTKGPSGGYGIQTGHFNGIFVVDLDVKEGKNGIAALLALAAGRPIPDTQSVLTPSGGVHLYFRLPPDAHVPTTHSVLAPGHRHPERRRLRCRTRLTAQERGRLPGGARPSGRSTRVAARARRQAGRATQAADDGAPHRRSRKPRRRPGHRLGQGVPGRRRARHRGAGRQQPPLRRVLPPDVLGAAAGRPATAHRGGLQPQVRAAVVRAGNRPQAHRRRSQLRPGQARQDQGSVLAGLPATRCTVGPRTPTHESRSAARVHVRDRHAIERREHARRRSARSARDLFDHKDWAGVLMFDSLPRAHHRHRSADEDGRRNARACRTTTCSSCGPGSSTTARSSTRRTSGRRDSTWSRSNRAYNPIQDWLRALEWDGVTSSRPRAARLLPDPRWPLRTRHRPAVVHLASRSRHGARLPERLHAHPRRRAGRPARPAPSVSLMHDPTWYAETSCGVDTKDF